MGINLLQKKIVAGCIFFLLQPSHSHSQDTLNFLPPSNPATIIAVASKSPITIDGKLSEPDWQTATSIKDFFRMEPRQGGEYRFRTFVKILYDKKHIYFGVFCEDPLGRKGLRVQDYRRDFAQGENDTFFIQLDPQNLKRFCVSFQATPLGTQRDLQVFDDMIRDNDWDALWRVRTTVVDSGYVAEFAIPFKSLRYNKQQTDSASWNFTLARIARRDYEQIVFPPIPQAFSPYRMSYAAQLKGLELPPPSINLRAQPYFLFQHDKTTASDQTKTSQSNFKVGGDIKWAVNPHTVVDLTFNTDFAQADVDRAVNNLTRFNIQFPERRQFFLENQGIFAGANISGLKPFFSRTIGLSNTQFNSDPIPLDVGLRYTSRTRNRSIAGLYARQRETDQQMAAHFGVARYLFNYGHQNNTGFMVTHRSDEQGYLSSGQEVMSRQNTTLTWDGLIRPAQKLTLQYLASVSRDNSNENIGHAGNVRVEYKSNKFFFYYLNRWITEKYKPGMGFVFQNNVIFHQTVQYFAWRPKHPKLAWIREWEIGFDVDYYQNASDFKFQQSELYLYPVYIITKNGGLIQYAIFPTWQNINFDFSILGIPIEQQQYFYTIHQLDIRTDQSRKLALNRTTYRTGKYYNGRFESASTGFRFAPTPKIALTADFTWNKFIGLGEFLETKETKLYTAGIRLAINPRLQSSVFFEYNSFTDLGRWNVRTSWEFAPLSFIYVVFNDNSILNSSTSSQSFINKITYVKQF